MLRCEAAIAQAKYRIFITGLNYFLPELINNIKKAAMSGLPCDQVKLEFFDFSQQEVQQPQTIKDNCSTRYSKSTKSAFLQHQENQSISYSSSLKGPCSSLRRKEQNKQSAKKCRIRKKERCLELQRRERQLTEELSRLQVMNSMAKHYLEKEMSGSNVHNIFTNNGRAQAYDRLNKIIKTEHMVDEDEINLILDNLRHRVGATGIERQAKINYIVKQIIHIYFPALHRYFMWTAHNSLHYFGENQGKVEWMNQVDQILNLTQEQKEVIQSKKDNFTRQFQTFTQLINEMRSTKSELQKQSAKLEELIEEVRCMLTPIQCGRVVTFIENYKYKQEMELWVKRNMRKFSQQTTPAADPGPRKMVKKEEP